MVRGIHSYITHESFCFSETTVQVSSVSRSSVELPCNLTSPILDDEVRLVLWFKNDSAKPIYTYDTRGKSINTFLSIVLGLYF